MVLIKLKQKKSLKSRISSLEKNIEQNLSRRKFKKIEKLITRYNELIDSIWASGPGRFPLYKIEGVDRERSVLKRDSKCGFCGSDKWYVEVLPFLFGTVKFFEVCKKEDCQNVFEDYAERYLKLLEKAHEDLSRYDLSIDE